MKEWIARTGEMDVLRAAQRGDKSAFDALVSPHLPRCYRLAYLIAHDTEAAADALQEALIRAHRSLGNVQEARPFLPWFSQIVVREAIKQAKRRTPIFPWSLWAERQALEATASPETITLDKEERETLWQVVQQLRPIYRAVIVLRYHEGLSEREIADQLGIAPGTVKSRLNYARGLIEHRMRREGERIGPRTPLGTAQQGGIQHVER